MKQSIMCVAVLVAGLLASSACGSKGTASVPNSQSNAAQSNSPATGELRYKAPDGWVKEQTTSSMRVAQYKLPKTEGDPEDALLVLYFFGATQGGAVQANIDRWISQMQQPDGSASKDKARTETSTVNGLKITSVDVSGTYTAEMAPGTPGQRHDANYRMRAAVIETPRGNYFLKLVGPAKTMGTWEQSVTDFVKSFEFK
jgi:predicted small lipoprotein YifL